MDQTLDLADLPDVIRQGDREALKELCRRFGLVIENGRIRAADPKAMAEIADFWSHRQLVRKVLLNSVYGALLNEGSRFHDRRLGSAVTMSGRVVLGTIAAEVSGILTGERRRGGDPVLYGDTDSVYFSAASAAERLLPDWRVPENVDEAAELADNVAERVNAALPERMRDAFGIDPDMSVISVGRESVARSALFVRKKRYALLVEDDEGVRLDPPKVKVRGFETNRSDTPPVVQEFLRGIIRRLLEGADRSEIDEDIRRFRDRLRGLDPWAIGRLQTVKVFPEKFASGRVDLAVLVETKGMPGHVRAALAWNALADVRGDRASPRITPGEKVVVCHLRPNPMRLSSIALPTSVEDPPSWFRELPFDTDRMVDDMLESRLGGIMPERRERGASAKRVNLFEEDDA